jgi:hypothetical protein
MKVTTQCHKRLEVCHTVAVACRHFRTQYITVSVTSSLVSVSNSATEKCVARAGICVTTVRAFPQSLQTIAPTRQFRSMFLPVHCRSKKQPNSMSYNSCWETELLSCSRNYLPLMVHYHIHKRPTLGSVLNYMNAVNPFMYHVLQIHFNIILSCTPMSRNLPLPFRFADKTFICISRAHVRARRPAHLICIDLTSLIICMFGEQ